MSFLVPHRGASELLEHTPKAKELAAQTVSSTLSRSAVSVDGPR